MISTLHSRLSAAELCRRNGWGVGTRLVGNEGYGDTVIEITAVGSDGLLARTISHGGKPSHGRENSWVLWCREWSVVA